MNEEYGMFKLKITSVGNITSYEVYADKFSIKNNDKQVVLDELQAQMDKLSEMCNVIAGHNPAN